MSEQASTQDSQGTTAEKKGPIDLFLSLFADVRAGEGLTSIIMMANVLLLLEGSCVVAGKPLAADTLLVTKRTEPATYAVASLSDDCLLFALAFE